MGLKWKKYSFSAAFIDISTQSLGSLKDYIMIPYKNFNSIKFINMI